VTDKLLTPRQWLAQNPGKHSPLEIARGCGRPQPVGDWTDVDVANHVQFIESLRGIVMAGEIAGDVKKDQYWVGK
jgi:hypothetical protein